MRDLTVRTVEIDALNNTTIHRSDTDEYLARAYVFWTPTLWLGLRAEYIFERQDSELTGFLPDRVDTHRIPLGLRIFHPSGLGGFLTATYFNQDGEDFVRTNGTFQSGHSEFWTVDVGLNYRLPKRYGFITFGVTNVFDKQFDYFERDFNNPTIQPTRMIFGKVTLALP